MVRMIHRSGCEHDLLQKLSTIGKYKCQTLSDIDKLNMNYKEQFSLKRTTKINETDTTIRSLESEREDIKNNYTDGIQQVVGWFRSIPPSIKIFSQRNQLQRALNRLDTQENNLTDYFSENKHFIVGARGENKVITELQKLPDEYIVINDYTVDLGRYVYWKKYGENVLTAQIDHIVLSPYGIFILETKNWSQQTLDNSLASRKSVIWQIERQDFALWCLLRNTRYHRVRKYRFIVLPHGLSVPNVEYIDFFPVSYLVSYIQRKQERVLENSDVDRLLRLL